MGYIAELGRFYIFLDEVRNGKRDEVNLEWLESFKKEYNVGDDNELVFSIREAIEENKK